MHLRNGDAPYQNSLDAVARWAETATAIVARLRDGRVEVAAPHGVEDLLALRLRPVPDCRGGIKALHARCRDKGWLRRWPRLVMVAGERSQA